MPSPRGRSVATTETDRDVVQRTRAAKGVAVQADVPGFEWPARTNSADFYLPVGQVKNKGVELGAVGQITDNWKVNAGYAYLDPKISEDSTASLVGQTQLWLPWNTGSAFLVYTFNQGPAQGLSFGVGGRFVGSVHTSYDRSTRDIPGYSVADVNIGYARDKWLVNLNVRNVLGEHYFINEWQTLYYGNSLGAPANFSLSGRYEF
jgi:outer membrane receptor protein involved in Fe transport